MTPMPTTRSTERSGTTALRRIPRREPALQPSDVLSKGAQTLHGQRARAELACQVVTREVGLADPHSTRIAVREHDEEPDVTVPTVRLLGSDGLPDQGVAPARQANLCRERRLNVLQSVVHSKLGAALRHLPSGFVSVNRTWMWSAFLALNISTWLQSLCGLDAGPHGRAHGKRLRRELIAIPARVLRHAHRLVLRVAPEQRDGVFADAWATLLAMASFAGP